MSWTWWGGLLGPALTGAVDCLSCGTRYNGRTGAAASAGAAAYVAVTAVVGVVLVVAVQGRGTHGYDGYDDYEASYTAYQEPGDPAACSALVDRMKQCGFAEGIPAEDTDELHEVCLHAGGEADGRALSQCATDHKECSAFHRCAHPTVAPQIAAQLSVAASVLAGESAATVVEACAGVAVLVRSFPHTQLEAQCKEALASLGKDALSDPALAELCGEWKEPLTAYGYQADCP